MRIVYIVALFALCANGVVHAEGSNEEVKENITALITKNQCSGCNLSGADLNRLDLSGADLSGADLTGATFFLADLSGANLRNSILRGVQFGGADLAGADLSGADMRGAVLNGAYLTGAKLDGSFESKPITDDSELKDVKEKVYISDQSKPKQAVESREVEISGGREEKVKEAGAADEPQKKVEALIEAPSAPPEKKAIPVQSVTIDSKSKSSVKAPVINEKTDKQDEVAEKEEKSAPENQIMVAKADNAGPMEQAEPRSVEKSVSGEKMGGEEKAGSFQMEMMVEKLKDENTCYRCSFVGADLAEIDLEDADLEGVDFTEANLEGADFEDANLKGAIFRKADLRNANFKGADLYKADFSNSDVTGADFDDAEMDEAIFDGTIGYQVNLMTGDK